MGFGGRGGGFRGGGGGGGFRGGGRGGRGGGGGFRGGYDQGPPEEVVEVGHFTHTCEDDIVCHTTAGKIPYFNAPVFFENKQQIGKIDEIFGGIRDHGFSVKLSDGVKASSFKENQKIYIDPSKMLPLERFLQPQSGGRGRGGRGGRGGDRGGRGGGFRGGDRGRGGGGFRGGDRGRGGGGFRGGDRGGRGGGFRGGDRGGGFRGGDRGGGFRGGDRGGRGGFGGQKRFSEGGNQPQGKKTKFDD
uniref:H/ACA ribonucleoprotein complex subunit n=1 Tax=Acrobeloides nanus TaxID=290746 RepID=A0A914CY62_9BILA